jgi:transcriptional regulator with XRE-family HTH domain
MPDHERLDRAIQDRAVELDLSYLQLAERAGISDVSLRNFRKGRGVLRPRNQRRLEVALGWAPGSIGALLDGGEPAQAAPDDQVSADELREMIAETEDEIANLEVRHERNRPYLVAHLERRLAELRSRLASLQ